METLKDKIIELIDNSEYNEAAELAAKVLQFELKFEGVRFDSMPWDTDGQKRYIVSCNLIRGDKSYKFDYGTNLKNSCVESSEWDEMSDTDMIKIYAGRGTVDYKFIGSVEFNITKFDFVNNLTEDFIRKQAQIMINGFESSVERYNKNKPKMAQLSYRLTEDEAISAVNKAITAKEKELKQNKAFSKTEALPHSKMPSVYDVITCLQKENPGDTFEDFCDWLGYDNDSRSAERIYITCLKEYNQLKQIFNEEELEALFYIQ